MIAKEWLLESLKTLKKRSEPIELLGRKVWLASCAPKEAREIVEIVASDPARFPIVTMVNEPVGNDWEGVVGRREP